MKNNDGAPHFPNPTRVVASAAGNANAQKFSVTTGSEFQKNKEENTMADRNLQQELDSLKTNFNQLKKDWDEMAATGGSMAGDVLAATKKKFDEEAQKLMENLQKAAETVQDHGKKMYDQVERQVEEKPVTSLMTTLGVGFIIGWLIGKK